MTCEHGEVTMLLIVTCLLMRLVLVIGDSNITSDFATTIITTTTTRTSTATTTTTTTAAAAAADNQYPLSTLHEEKSSSKREEKLYMKKWPLSDKGDEWTDDLSRTIMNKGLKSIMNKTTGGDGRKNDEEKRKKLKKLRVESVIDNNTNSSTTMPLWRKIISDYNNGVKIVQNDEGMGKSSPRRQQLLAIKKRRQLSSPITSAQKIIEDYSYIEVKDPPDLRITPISLPDIDYDNSNGEEFYEEMDELLKLKRMLDDKKILGLSNKKKQRGDMNPILSSLTTMNDREKVPIRGDIVTRNKRSYDEELWGFDENEGYVSSSEVVSTSSDQPIDQLPREIQEDESINLNSEEEKKLLGYIVRNRPIVISNKHKNDNEQQSQQSQYLSKTDPLLDNKYHIRSYHLIEEKQPIVSLHNFDDTKHMSEKAQAQINKIPVSARIIITRDPSLSSITTLPPFLLRGNFDNDVEFPEINPNREGLKAMNFPSPSTQSPLKTPPNACIWAILQCCPNNTDNRRLLKCFEYMGCPGINWDPNPCRIGIMEAARGQVIKYYTSVMR